ncbi:conditioned medium-induced protein 4 [Halobellus sp. GM3]|uniref:conditioned medium-induced protein 4 n=1 Tax=Halobellus sp. GM3 TaxID=3458410 RepID=UPI00403D5BA1
MDEKTAELRELFVETTGAESVTESQADSRGTLSSTDGGATAERLGEVIATMRERSDFASSLPEADLRRVVRGFFDPDAVGAHADSWSREADAALAASLEADADADAVFRARMDLHLVADADRDSPFPFERLRRLVLAHRADAEASEPDDESLAAALDREDAAGDDRDSTPRPDAETVRRYRRVVEADLASRGVNHRFRDAFAELLTDADLSTRLAEDARRDGLREATEDIETDVSL